ncbi:YqgU-like beta propeller domain-containing protein [Pseudoneobacillus sp. C159]
MNIRFKLIYMLILFLGFLVILSSCKAETFNPVLHSKSELNSSQNLKDLPPASFFSVYQLPIIVPKGNLNRVIGWLSNDEIVYLSQSSEASYLYLHTLSKGKSELLFESEYPIVTGVISPDYQEIIIHSSPSSYEGKVVIINKNGSESFSQSFPSVEMGFEWNQYDANQLFITAFNEDWSFTNYYLELDRKLVTRIDIRKPFAKWTGNRKMAFLDWNDEDISLLSPLVEKSFDQDERRLADDIFQFDTFLDRLLTITIDGDNQLAKYQFFSKEMSKEASFLIPVLSSYSGWLVPHYELTSEGFLSMVPLKSEEADIYQDGFQLVLYNLQTGKHEVLLEELDNYPFTCSPNGKLCLMGYQFEKLLNLKTKMLTQLF